MQERDLILFAHKMNNLCTWLSFVLLGAMISYQPACNKTPLDPKSQLDKDSPWNIAVNESENDPFSQESTPVTNPSQDHTIKLLRETVFPLVDWPEQPLPERLKLIQQEASKVGLAVKISEDLAVASLIYPSLRIRNTSLALAIKYTADCTKLRYRITDTGDIYFFCTGEKVLESKVSAQDVNEPHEKQSEQDIAPNDR